MSRLLTLLTLCVISAVASAEKFYDPTRPPAGVAAPAAAERGTAAPLRVSFIISGERRLARINGRWVGEGDRVGGAEVVRISPGSVRLRREGKLFDLPVQGGGVRKRPSEPTG